MEAVRFDKLIRVDTAGSQGSYTVEVVVYGGETLRGRERGRERERDHNISYCYNLQEINQPYERWGNSRYKTRAGATRMKI